MALANTIAENAPLAVRTSKQVMKQAGELPDAQGWAINNEAVPAVFGSADAMEGPIAFAEKRKPNWTGSSGSPPVISRLWPDGGADPLRASTASG